MSVRADGDPAVLSAIRTAIEPLSKSLSVELQQRATEYLLLLDSQWDGLRPELLARMPVLDEATLRSRRAFTTLPSAGGDMLLDSPSKGQAGGGNDLMNLLGTPPASGGSGSGGGNLSAPASAGTAGSSLLDLDDIFGSPAPPAMGMAMGGVGASSMGSGTMPPAAPAPTDMLSDMFGTSTSLSPSTSTPASASPSQPTSMNAGAMGGSSSLMGSPAPVLGSSLGPLPPRAAPIVIAYDKDGLTVAIEVTKPEPANPSKTHLLCKFSNSTSDKFSNMSFQAAVPKYLKLEMHPPSSSDVPAASKDLTTQTITLVNSLQGEKNIMLKVKISYTKAGSKVPQVRTYICEAADIYMMRQKTLICGPSSNPK